MKSRFLVFLFVLGFQPLFAQAVEVYSGLDGTVGISIYYGDTLITIGSRDLITTLQYETADVRIQLDPQTLNSHIDSLDEKIRNVPYGNVVFEGALGVDYINTEDHGPQTFDAEGYLTINGITGLVLMNGSLEHWDSDLGIACMLYLHADIALEDFGLSEVLVDFAPIACIEIRQPLLQPQNR